MSTLKADAIEAATGTNTDLDLAGKGTGVPDIATGFKVGGTAGVPVNNLRTGTDGELITWDASGDPATVAVGTATHVLTSNGAGAAPTFQAAAAGGAWTLIGTQVASASASLTQTGLDSTYDTYAIAFSDLVPATDGVFCFFRVGDSGGIDSGASDYGYAGMQLNSGDTAYAGYGDLSDSELQLAGQATGSSAGEGFGMVLYLNRPGDGSMRPTFTGVTTQIDSSNTLIGGVFIGNRKAVITLDRVQFLFSSGNIASGRMTVWGISHA
jgi:hypothetical protein